MQPAIWATFIIPFASLLSSNTLSSTLLEKVPFLLIFAIEEDEIFKSVIHYVSDVNCARDFPSPIRPIT